MIEDAPHNPYLNPDLGLAPFAGRQTLFARLHQHLTDPIRREALLFIGQRRSGKSAFLCQFSRLFDETFLGVYVPLPQTPLDGEGAFLRALIRTSTSILTERGFTISRLTEPPNDDALLRDWLRDTGLPEFFATIRPQRRLVWLLDDADHLINAIVSYRFPIDHFRYLHELLEKYPQLGMALTLDAGHEAETDALNPLASGAQSQRFTNLSAEETALLLRQPPQGLYSVDDSAAAAVYRATGGQSELAQRFGFLLYQAWEKQPDHTEFTGEDIKALTPLIYSQCETDFKALWARLDKTERLVLTALSSLVFNDPLRKIDTSEIQAWLVETDYPTDMTAIGAAVRSLEYREVLISAPAGITLTSGLLQTWLVENARLGGASAEAASAPVSRRWIGLAILVVVLLVIGVLLAINASRPRTGEHLPDATITLVGATPSP